MTGPEFERDVVVVGGCGRVGLPLAVVLAKEGLRVAAYDLNEATVKLINDGTMPFAEPGAEDALTEAVDDGRLSATTDPRVVATARNIIVVIGTPVDEHLNPDPDSLPRALAACNPHFRNGQLDRAPQYGLPRRDGPGRATPGRSRR